LRKKEESQASTSIRAQVCRILDDKTIIFYLGEKNPFILNTSSENDRGGFRNLEPDSSPALRMTTSTRSFLRSGRQAKPGPSLAFRTTSWSCHPEAVSWPKDPGWIFRNLEPDSSPALRMTTSTRSFLRSGRQADPVILRGASPPEGSGVVFQESGTRFFASAQNDNLVTFRTTRKTRSFLRSGRQQNQVVASRRTTIEV